MGNGFTVNDRTEDTNNEEFAQIKITNAVVISFKWWKPWVTVVYIDLPTILSFDIFDKIGVSPWGFRKFYNEELSYIGIVCRVWKHQIPRFFECMNDLRKIILMGGHNDYDDFCIEFIYQDGTEIEEREL